MHTKVISFWASANPETQRVYGINYDSLAIDVKSLYLVSDSVFCPVGSVFESTLTWRVFKTLTPLFTDKKFNFTVKHPITTFRMYAHQKQMTSALDVYANSKLVEQIVTDLEVHCNLHVIETGSINSLIVKEWCNDFDDKSQYSIGSYLNNTPPSIIVPFSYIKEVQKISESCEKDFDWQYLYSLINRRGIPTPFYHYCQRRLSQFYISLSSESLAAAPDRQLYSAEERSSPHCNDVSLFLQSLEALGLSDALLKIEPKDVIKISNHPSFIFFRKFYLFLLHASEMDPEIVKEILSISKSVNSGLAGEREILIILSSFYDLSKQALKKYSKPIDVMKQCFDVLQVNPIRDFIDLIMSKAEVATSNVSTHLQIINTKQKGDNMISVFISHSAKDDKLAESFAHMLMGCLSLSSKSIRCSSAPGFKFEGSTHVSSRIKAEISECQILVGLISKNSIRSNYVNFELGAGWFLDKAHALVTKDVKPVNIPGPLKECHALKLYDITDLRQFVEHLSSVGIGQIESFNIIEAKLKDFISTLP